MTDQTLASARPPAPKCETNGPGPWKPPLSERASWLAGVTNWEGGGKDPFTNALTLRHSVPCGCTSMYPRVGGKELEGRDTDGQAVVRVSGGQGCRGRYHCPRVLGDFYSYHRRVATSTRTLGVFIPISSCALGNGSGQHPLPSRTSTYSHIHYLHSKRSAPSTVRCFLRCLLRARVVVLEAGDGVSGHARCCTCLDQQHVQWTCMRLATHSSTCMYVPHRT